MCSFRECGGLAERVLQVLVCFLLNCLGVLELPDQLHLQHLHLSHLGLLLGFAGLLLSHLALVVFLHHFHLALLVIFYLHARVFILLLTELVFEFVLIIHLCHIFHLLLLVILPDRFSLLCFLLLRL